MLRRNPKAEATIPESIPIDQVEREALNKATNLFGSLLDQHPSAKSEWCFYMHGLQGLMEHRICKKLYPDYFR